MNLHILRALLKKEFISMRRNPIIPKIILAMPLMVMLVIPLVANLDVRNVKVCIIDNDHTQLSRRIVADIGSTESLQVEAVCNNHSEAIMEMERGDADVILTIPHGLASDPTGILRQIYIEANGVNATKGMLGAQYVSQSVTSTISQWGAQQGKLMPDTTLSTLYLYNPTLNFKYYMIPALIGVLLILICGFLPALNLVSEKENGTIDAINVSPVGRFTFVLSKLIPFWIVGLILVSVGLGVGWLVYGLTPQGSLWTIYFAVILFSLVMSGLGVAIANTSSTMLQSIFVMFAFIMIFQLMSGLFTPISSMPVWAQVITYAIPPRYLIEIMRAVCLKGTPISELWLQFSALIAFAALTLLIAAQTYSKRN